MDIDALLNINTNSNTNTSNSNSSSSSTSSEAGAKAKRSSTVILVKNLPAATQAVDLVKLFSVGGEVARILLPPSRYNTPYNIIYWYIPVYTVYTVTQFSHTISYSIHSGTPPVSHFME